MKLINALFLIALVLIILIGVLLFLMWEPVSVSNAVQKNETVFINFECDESLKDYCDTEWNYQGRCSSIKSKDQFYELQEDCLEQRRKGCF